MRAGVLERRYAKAFLKACDGDLAIATKCRAELINIEALFDMENAKKILISPVIPGELKAALLDEATKGACELVKHFVNATSEAGRLENLPAIIAAFKSLLDEKEGILNAEITTAVEIDDDNVKSIAAAISSSKKVNIMKKVNPDILGGLIVKVGNSVVDMSLKKQLTVLAKATIS